MDNIIRKQIFHGFLLVLIEIHSKVFVFIFICLYPGLASSTYTVNQKHIQRGYMGIFNSQR